MAKNIPMRWGYAFLQSDTKLNLQEREDLLKHAVEMYLKDTTRSEVNCETYSGTVHMKGYGSLEGFGGVEFTAHLDTEKGKANLAFLVSEQTASGFGSVQRDQSLLN